MINTIKKHLTFQNTIWSIFTLVSWVMNIIMYSIFVFGFTILSIIYMSLNDDKLKLNSLNFQQFYTCLNTTIDEFIIIGFIIFITKKLHYKYFFKY